MAKKPQINTFSGLKGIDGEIQSIQDLMNMSWLDYSFGLTETLVREDPEAGTIVFPGFFNTNKSDSQDLRPNDRWGAYCFWRQSSPTTYDYADGLESHTYRWGSVLRTANVDCIFYMDLSKIATTNYKVEKTEVRDDIEKFFDTLNNYAGIVTPRDLIDYDIKEVFSGYTLGGLPERWFYLPYYGVKVNMDISFYNSCT